MLSGALDRRIIISRRSVSVDAGGRETVVWPVRATRWAKARPVRGGEQLRGGQLTPEAIVEFTIRWEASAVAETDRITFDGKLYDVTHIAEIGRRDGLLITAKHPAKP